MNFKPDANNTELLSLRAENKALQKELRKASRELSSLTAQIERFRISALDKDSLRHVISAEKARRQMYLDNLLRVMPEIVVFMNTDLEIVMCSESFLKATGVSSYGEVIGLPAFGAGVFERLGGKKPEQVRKELLAVMRNKELHEEAVHFSFIAGSPKRYYKKYTMPICDEYERVVGVIILFIDLSDLVEAKEKAQSDVLTGLYNRGAFEEQVSYMLNNMRVGQLHALAIIDFDYFKQINDTYGHMQGDKALKELAALLRQSFRSADIVARMGGDEFGVFCIGINSEQQLAKRMERLISTWRKTHHATEDGGSFVSTLSIGFAVAPRDGVTYKELFKKADIALYRSKQQGRNQYTAYNPESADKPYFCP